MNDQRKINNAINIEEIYLNILNSLNEPMHIIDRDYNFQFLNLAMVPWLEKYNINPEIIGKNLFKVFPFLKNNKVIEEYEKVFKTGKTLITQEVTHLKYGRVFTDTQKVPIINNGKVEQVITVLRDTTEQRESEEKFRTIAEQAFIGILILQDDKVEYVNNALLQIFEYSHDEVKNWTKDDLIKLIYPGDLQSLRQYRKRLQEDEDDPNPFYSYRVFTKYGRLRWIDQFSKQIISRGKSAELITIMDITEKKKAEQELIKLNNLKSEILRRTSHELKTPLVSIKGFSDLLLTVHKEKLNDYVLATIHEIKLGCERLENLIQDILKTSELESEVVELKKKEEDLSFLIKLCIKELNGLIRLRDHKIVLDIHDKLISWFEPDQIHLVISNLLSNAIKYTPPSGKIIVKSAKTQDYIIISIEDSGVGITNEEKKRLFSQFGKIERYGQGLDIITEGSGLGLYISKKIIELHGGKIKVKSNGRHRGSIFSFSIPRIIKNKE
ncbi:MAG: ATP-binding protein [Candidatus Odinarchaeota archaeon]